MALRTAGVELVVKNFSGFIGAMGRVNSTLVKTGQDASKMAQQVTAAGDRVTNAQRAQANSAARLVQALIRQEQAGTRLAQAEQRLESIKNKDITTNKRVQAATDALAKAKDNLAVRDAQLKAAMTASQNVANNANSTAKQQNTALNNLTKAADNYGKALGKQKEKEDAINVANAKATKAMNNNKSAIAAAEEAVKKYTDAVTIADKNVEIASNNQESNILRVQRAQEKLAEITNAVALGRQLGTGGIGGIAGGIGAIGTTLSGIGIAIAAVVAGLAVFAAGAVAAFGAAKKLAEVVVSGLVAGFKLLLGILTPVLSALWKIVSVPIARAFEWLTGAIKGVTDGLADSLAEFQRFGIMFEALIARDTAGNFENMTQALAGAVQPAKDLFGWVKRLAVTTPFTAKGITEVLAMANAMGLNISAAKDLTVAVGNFTAGMGLTEEHMWRIIYNFGQMLAQGKVTGREFRDLAISFVPVWKMLDEMAAKAGMATEEFKKLALEGKVPVPAFFQEFITMAQRDFPNAMERMARTWAGVIGNAKDFIQVVVGMNLFGRVFNQITAAMADSLQELIKYLTPLTDMIGVNLATGLSVAAEGFRAVTDALDAFKANVTSVLGLGSIFDTHGWAGGIAKAAVLIRELGNTIAGIIRWINDNVTGGLKNVAKSAGAWGYNIVAMIAQGMAAAVKLIVQVVNYIARILAYWLAPGSPPKAFPDLPKWGMKAMAEYLHGFTLADFDALEGIQGPLKEALSILVDTGKLGERAAANLYRDLSVAIAKAISTGVIEESLFERIARAAGPFGDEIARLARLQIQLAVATNELAAAEKALEEARKREATARKSINAKVREYNKLLRAGADKATLDARLAEINVTEVAARAATQERVQQEALVEAMKEQVAVLQEAVQLQERLVQQLLEITREQIIKIDTSAAAGQMGELAEMLENMDWGIPTPLEDIDAGDLARANRWKELQAYLNWKDAMTEAETWISDLKKDMGTLFEPARESLGELETAWGKISKIMGGGVQDPRRPQKTNFDKAIDAFENLKRAIKLVSDEMSILMDTLSLFGLRIEGLTFVEKLAGFLGLVALGVANVIRAISNGLIWIALFLEVIRTISGWLLEIGDGFAGLGDTVNENIDDFMAWGAGVKESVMEATNNVAEWLGNIGEDFETWRLGAVATVNEWGAETGEAFRAWEATVIQIVQETVDAFMYKIEYWRDRLKLKWISFLQDARTFWESIKAAIKLKVDAIVTLISTTLQNAFNNFKTTSLYNAIMTIVRAAQALYEKLKNLYDALHGRMAQTANTGIEEDNQQFGGSVKKLRPSIVGEHGWEMYMPLADGMILNQRQIADAIGMAASQAYGNTMPYLRNMVNSPAQYAPSVVNNRQVNVNFGGVVIAGEMDMAVFESRVRNVIRQEFT